MCLYNFRLFNVTQIIFYFLVSLPYSWLWNVIIRAISNSACYRKKSPLETLEMQKKEYGYNAIKDIAI